MNDTPKDDAAKPHEQDAEAAALAAGEAVEQDAAAVAPDKPIDVEWEDALEDAPAAAAGAGVDAASSGDGSPEQEAPEVSDAAVGAAAAAAGAAAAGGAGGEAPGEHDRERRGGGSALVYVWLLLLTVGGGYLAYTIINAPRVAPDQIAEVAGRVDSAETGIAAMGETATANATAIAALKTSTEDANAAVARQADEVRALMRQVEALEPRLAELQAAIADAAAKTPAAPAPAPADTGAVEAAQAAQAAAETAQVAAEAADAAAAANAAALKGMADDIAARNDDLASAMLDLQNRLGVLEARANRSGGRSLAAAILALNDLRAGVASGKPFGQLLDRAQAALPDAETLEDSAWTAFADKGLPTAGDLLADMQAISLAIGQDKLKARLKSGESWFDRAVGGVVDRLKVRRVGAGVEGEDAAAVAARAEAALNDGDVATAIAEVESLSGEDADRFKGWLSAAKAAVAATADLDAIEKAAIAAADGT